jgi:hypothetical protein
MPGYWWECLSCKLKKDIRITHFIWDVLLPSDWEQSHLSKQCNNCGENNLRITYKFPPYEIFLSVKHIVGLGPFSEEYVPMMWETQPYGDWKTIPYGKEGDIWFDFKYLKRGKRRNNFGLRRPAVFNQGDLKDLIELYKRRTGISEFP